MTSEEGRGRVKIVPGEAISIPPKKEPLFQTLVTAYFSRKFFFTIMGSSLFLSGIAG